MYFWRGLPAVICWHLLHFQQCCYAAPISSTSSSTAPVSTATPLVIPPSQLWDGNDGPWSSFYLRVGSPPQMIRVLVSTSSNQPLVVLPEGCSSEDSNCANDRGGIFQTNSSTTWKSNNSTTGGVYAVALNSNIGLIPEVHYGSDTIALSYLGSGTPALSSQLVGGITTTDLFTGIFGLNPAATNFSNDSPVVASYMSTLKAQNQIPSLSYGYNAGNGYRFNTVLASLTLGGYDASLFNANNLTFAFNSQGNADLTVNIKSIAQTSSSRNGSLSTTSFPAFIDTTTPYLWLPDAVCTQFENAFGLTYDNASGLYLVNDTLHTTLLAQNATVTFTLGNGTSSETVDIALPYAAFDLIASSPLVETPTRYFPLKRANSTSEVTLGRTFFQEAYLIADYERATFSVSQMRWDPNAQAAITSILPQSVSSSPSTSSSPTQKQNKNVPTTTIVAATICGAVFLTVLTASIILIRQRQKKLHLLIKSPPTPAFSPAFATIPRNCEHCHSLSSSPEPVEAGSGSQSFINSTQTSSLEDARRKSTPIPSGLTLPPISPISPLRSGPELQRYSQMGQISPSSPGFGPVIPPRFSSLDRVASPTSYYSYHVPDVSSDIHELPAREPVIAEIAGTPVESLLQQALDDVLIQHNREQEYRPYQPSTSSPAQAEGSRRWTLHSPVYGQRAHPHPQIRVTVPQNQGSNWRTSQWVHSPIYGQIQEGQAQENWSTLSRGNQFSFDIHPQLRTARPQPQPQPQPYPHPQIRSPIQSQSQSHYSTQAQASGSGSSPSSGTRTRSRDLILEHEERMREWRAMRGPRASSPTLLPAALGANTALNSHPPTPTTVPHLSRDRHEADREREDDEEESPSALDPREFGWLRDARA
ncbi:hypothetical protein EG329_005810 [Mollisiaceae sp. DMI_Dod_QoI]|nr:hypothetical protein EG329_005810 [Helotiales sp. DMI_Dod_QoI]